MRPFENNVPITRLTTIYYGVGMIMKTLFYKGRTKNLNYLLDIVGFYFNTYCLKYTLYTRSNNTRSDCLR